jgi:peptidoglycan/LPS O-acetylase OafA/YrhL
VRVGAVLFGIGVVAVLVVVVPFFFGVENRPVPLNVAAGGLPPLGLALALLGVLRAGRARRLSRRPPRQR